MARDLGLAIDFIDLCVDRDTTIHLMNDIISTINPDEPGSQFMRKMIGLLMHEDRKHRIRQIKRGVAFAQREGKWTGRTPAGFETDDEAYLVVDMEDYFDIRSALERIEAGESQRLVAGDAPVSRQALSSILDDHRLEIYLGGTQRSMRRKVKVRRDAGDSSNKHSTNSTENDVYTLNESVKTSQESESSRSDGVFASG